jgi:Spy/CpxP family protein refolding chaperone
MEVGCVSMGMKRFSRILPLMCVVGWSVVCVSADAEPPSEVAAPGSKRGRPDGSAGNKGPGDIGIGSPDAEGRLKMMTEKLGLSLEQQEKVRIILERNAPELRSLMAQGRENASEADKEKVRGLMRSQMEEIGTVLNPEQRAKMMEALKARGDRGDRGEGSGAVAGGRPPGEGGRVSPEERLKMMTERLGLNTDQQGRIRGIMEKYAPKLREAFSQGAGSGGGQGGELRGLMREQMKEISEVLSPEQRKKMMEGRSKEESGLKRLGEKGRR